MGVAKELFSVALCTLACNIGTHAFARYVKMIFPLAEFQIFLYGEFEDQEDLRGDPLPVLRTRYSARKLGTRGPLLLTKPCVITLTMDIPIVDSLGPGTMERCSGSWLR